LARRLVNRILTLAYDKSRLPGFCRASCTPKQRRQAGALKVFTALYGLTDAAERARELRDAGASGVATFEGQHDVFAPLTLAATVGGLDLMTNVAIAFPRNPIHLAHQAVDHQLLSGGRFFLGLGTQVRPQIEKRFGAQFDNPVARMTEMIAALRAIFEAWDTGGRLNFAAITTGTR
jgi:alkanesulfonate monooxygenase SsuD/methylene tetrahydromethanopterin reductase-like flavin-dependent oxidoreductase (luciferase family)